MKCEHCQAETKLESERRIVNYIMRWWRCGVCHGTTKELHAESTGTTAAKFRLTTGDKLYRRTLPAITATTRNKHHGTA